MANLPRFGRTWQRFSSLPRPGTAPRPEIQPATEPEVYPSAPATTNILQTSPVRERTSAISSPVRKLPSPPSSPIYRAAATTSPRKLTLPQTPTYNRYDGERRSSAPSSPKTFKPTTLATSPPRSPAKPKYSGASTTAPLSPLALPRSPPRHHEPQQTIRSRSPPEVQQKSILYQKTTTAEKAAKTEHRASEYSSGKPHQKQQQQQHQSDVINIKGENVGAVMHITESSGGTDMQKKKPVSLTHSSNNENSEESKTNKKSSTSSSHLPGKSFMNSNFQGVNNSILYNSSLSHRDPGLHLAFSKKPLPHSDHHQHHHLHDSTH